MSKGLIIQSGVFSSLGIPRIEVSELDGQHSSLDPVQPEIAAYHVVKVSRILAVVAKDFELLGEFLSVRSDQSAIAESPEVLGRIKRETAAITEIAALDAVPAGTDCLSGIFDNGNLMPLRDLVDGFHPGRLPEHMHGDYRLCFF